MFYPSGDISQSRSSFALFVLACTSEWVDVQPSDNAKASNNANLRTQSDRTGEDQGKRVLGASECAKGIVQTRLFSNG